MNLLHLLWVFLSFTVFTIALRAYTAVNRSDRNSLFNIYLQVFALIVFLFFIFGGMLNLPLFLICFFVAFSTVVPSIIGRLIKINQIKSKQPVLQLVKSPPVTFFWNITITIFLITLFLISMNNFFQSDKLIHDKDFFLDQIGITLFIGLYLIFQLMNFFQKTAIYTEGIFYYGIFWEWSDFQKYYWENSLKQNRYEELLLETSNDIWFMKQIKLAIPIDSRERVNTLMGQKINKDNESS